MERDASLHHPNGVPVARIVECGPALDPKSHRASNHFESANQPLIRGLARFRVSDWHEVDNLADTLGREKPGDQDIRIGPVELLVCHLLGERMDSEVAAFSRIEN